MDPLEIHKWMRTISLDDWLRLMSEEPRNVDFVYWMFPTDALCAEYLANIHKYSVSEVIGLLRNFLIPSGSLGCDDKALEELLKECEATPQTFEAKLKRPYYRRLFSGQPPWDGITWIEALLPDHPQKALDAIDAYILAYIQQLPDGRFSGLEDAINVIRAKFIGKSTNEPEGIRLLLDLKPRQFECLIERLYNRMGYDTQLTSYQKDGGVDIIAKREVPGRQEHILIECKQYDTNRAIGIEIPRQLLGVVAQKNVNKGAVVTTSRFTRSVHREFANEPRIELISGKDLIPLLDKSFGLNWSLDIENIIRAASQHGRLVETA